MKGRRRHRSRLSRLGLQWPTWHHNRAVRRFVTAFVLSFLVVVNFSGMTLWLTPPAIAQTATLSIEPLTWDFVGLDSNNVNVGPNSYLNGARVCNISGVGGPTATNVNVQFVREGAFNPYITVRALAEGRSDNLIIPQLPAGPASGNHHTVSGTPSNCFDAYFNIIVARNSSAYNTVQKYTITATASNSGTVSTPTNRQLYIEKILSQARNEVISFTGPSTVYVGDTVTYTLTATTATAYPQLTISSDFPNAVFQFLNVSTTYSNPGVNNSSVYADACGWLADYTMVGYHESSSVCDGPVPDQYPGGKVGETVVTKYTIKILSTGSSGGSKSYNVNHLILDFSGGSYHYNSDYGKGVGLATILVVDRQADLSIDKSHAGNFTVGSNLYTLTVKNNGNSTGADPVAKGPITVTDTLPAGFSYSAVDAGSSAGWTCAANGQLVTCTNPNDLANGATSTINLRVNVDASAATNTINTATVSSTSSDPNLTNNTDTDPTLIVQGANLKLTKSDGSATATNNLPVVTVGQAITYTMTVQNQSSSPAAAPITITDTLPTGLTFASGTGTNWTCTVEGQNISCTYSQALAGSSSAPALTLTANTNSAGIPSGTSAVITNTATVSSPSYDPTPNDNTSSDNFTLTLPVSDLTITKTHVGDFVQNSNGSYQITVTNRGVASTTGTITITETLPSTLGMSYQSHSGLGPTGTAITWTCTVGGVACTVGSTGTLTFTYPGPLAAGQSSQLNLVVKPTTVGTNVNNTVTVSTPNDGSTQTKTAADPTTVLADPGNSSTVILSVVKTISQIAGSAVTCTASGQSTTCPTLTPGNTVRYTITITNNTNQGPDSSTFTPTDLVPSIITNTTWTCTVTGGTGSGTNSCTASGSGNNINPSITLRKGGGTATIVVNGTLTSNATTLGSTTSLVNTVTIPVTIGTDVDDNPIDNIYTAIAPISRTDLAISKTDNGVTFTKDVEGTYILTVSNVSSNPTVDRITVVEDLPDSFDFVYANAGANSSGWVCSLTNSTSKIVTCTNDGPIAAGQSSQINLVVIPRSTGTGFVNSATVSTAGDSNSANNTGTDTTDVTTPNVDLQLTKSLIAGSPLTVGQSATYQIQVVNLGPTVASASSVAPIRVIDTLPTGLNFVSATGAGWSCTTVGQTVTCDRTTNLSVNTPSTITLNVLVDLNAAASITNVAGVNQHTNEPGDRYVLNNNGSTSRNNFSVTSAVTASADLAVVKTLAGTLVQNQQSTYTLQVSNNGPSNVSSEVTVTDTIPTGLTYSSATGTGFICTYDSGTRVVTCGRATGLTAGQTIPISVVVTVDATASGTIANTATVSSTVSDPTPANNTSTSSNPVNPQRADLGLTKTHFGSFAPGGQGTFSLGIKNYGPAIAKAPITLTDTLPSGMTLASYVAGPGWSCTGLNTALVSCTLTTDLAVGSSDGVDLTVNISSGAAVGSSLTNTASVTSSTPEPTPNTYPNTATDTVTLQNSADLSVTKTSTSAFVIDGQATYTLQVTNNGPGTATNPITLVDQLPHGLTYEGGTSSDPKWSCPTASTSIIDVTCTYSGSLTAGSSTGTLQIQVHVVDQGASTHSSYTNSVTVYSGTSDPNTTNNTTTLTTTRTANNRDYGDAPDSYGTDLTAGNSGTDPAGASHTTSTTLLMGTTATDAEPAPHTPYNGNSDDVNDTDDENGVSSFPLLSTTTTTYSVNVTVTNNSGSTATLIGWIDFNRNGLFQTSEGVSATVNSGVTNSTVTLTWNNLGSAGLSAGTTYARFRLTTDSSITTSTPGGAGGPGEVEDYSLLITDPTAGPPQVLLVKRITRINGTDQTGFVDGSGSVDNHANWPTPASTYLRGVIDGGVVKPGDQIEYTIYFLSMGGGAATNVQLCDLVPANSTFIPNAFTGQTPDDGGLPSDQGIALGWSSTAPATAPTAYLTNIIDSPDRGRFIAPNTAAPKSCNAPNFSAPLPAGSNPRGAIVVDIATAPTTIPTATAAGTPANSYGFVRFRATIN